MALTRIQQIKLLRAVLGWYLRDAKALADVLTDPPKAVQENVDAGEQALLEALRGYAPDVYRQIQVRRALEAAARSESGWRITAADLDAYFRARVESDEACYALSASSAELAVTTYEAGKARQRAETAEARANALRDEMLQTERRILG